MITLTAESREWKNTGQYIARITGRAAKYTYAREFVGRKSGSTSEALIDEPGIYEIGDIDKKGRKDPGFVIIVTRPAHCPPKTERGDPQLIRFPASETDVMILTKRMDQGESLDEMVECTVSLDPEAKYGYRVRGKGEAKRASTAATIEEAVEQCWQLLQAFPEREAKKVLAALKLRVSPRAEPAAETAAEPIAETTCEPTPETAEPRQR